MTHNYYLYNDPELQKLAWIPWDNNEALQSGKQGGALSLGLTEVGRDWPLIRYIIDDEDWMNDYKDLIKQFATEEFEETNMVSLYSSYYELLREYTVGDQGELDAYTFVRNDNEFDQAISALQNHVKERGITINSFLGQ